MVLQRRRDSDDDDGGIMEDISCIGMPYMCIPAVAEIKEGFGGYCPKKRNFLVGTQDGFHLHENCFPKFSSDS